MLIYANELATGFFFFFFCGGETVVTERGMRLKRAAGSREEALNPQLPSGVCLHFAASCGLCEATVEAISSIIYCRVFRTGFLPTVFKHAAKRLLKVLCYNSFRGVKFCFCLKSAHPTHCQLPTSWTLITRTILYLLEKLQTSLNKLSQKCASKSNSNISFNKVYLSYFP